MNETIKQPPNRFDLLSHIVRYRLVEIGNSSSYLSIVVLMISAVFFIQDIYIDIQVKGENWSHVVFEGGVFLAVLLAFGFELRRVIQLQASVNVTQQEIMRLKGHLAEVIGDEFDRWNLSKMEREVALLLIKGLSMREIAFARDVKEKSVRQQATAIYTKAGVSNRSELAAYFIEDLLLPSTS